MNIAAVGGAGFIGYHLCKALLERGDSVTIIDNMSREGSQERADDIKSGYPECNIMVRDISVDDLDFRSTDVVVHLAGQTAVTKSYDDIRRDFQDNVDGLFNTLEWARKDEVGYFVYASTNKVYGNKDFAGERCDDNEYPDPATPYGVGKFCGDLYVREYGKPEIGMNVCTLRQSCIYGPSQSGSFHQGWVSWLVHANMTGQPITVCGDGEQVRDILYIDNLVALYLQCIDNGLTGIYVVGGGEKNKVSVNELIDMIPKVTGKKFKKIKQADERPADQRFFVAENDICNKVIWTPSTGVKEGLEKLVELQYG